MGNRYKQRKLETGDIVLICVEQDYDYNKVWKTIEVAGDKIRLDSNSNPLDPEKYIMIHINADIDANKDIESYGHRQSVKYILKQLGTNYDAILELVKKVPLDFTVTKFQSILYKEGVTEYEFKMVGWK